MDGSSSDTGGAHQQSQTTAPTPTPAPTVMNPFDAVVSTSIAGNDANNENADIASVSSRSTAGMQSTQSSEPHHHNTGQGTASLTSSPKFGSAQLPQNPQQQLYLPQQLQQPQPQQSPSLSSQPQLLTVPAGLNVVGDSAGLVPPNLYVNIHHNTSSSPLQSAGNTPTQVPPHPVPVISTASSSGTMEAGASLTSPASGPDGADGILLGVQALEQQQANWEASQAAKRSSSGRPPQAGGSSHNLHIRSESAPPTNVLIESSDFIVQVRNIKNVCLI
jgi:hypothetical protein